MIVRSVPQSIDEEVEGDEFDEEEGYEEDGGDENYLEYKVGFLVAVLALFLMLVFTRKVTLDLIKFPTDQTTFLVHRINKSALDLFFNTGLVGSVILSLCVPLAFQWNRLKAFQTTAILALWMFVFIAIGFSLGVRGFADTCVLYTVNTTGTSPVVPQGTQMCSQGTAPQLQWHSTAPQQQCNVTANLLNMPSFDHVECADGIAVFDNFGGKKKTKFEVVGAILGACFAIYSAVAITAMGMLVGRLRGKRTNQSEKSQFGWSLSAICVDLMDWQDFTLTLIDGEVLEGCVGKGSTPWFMILACCVVSFIVITCLLVYEFTHSMGKISDEEEEEKFDEALVVKAAAVDRLFSPSEKYCVWASLIFIEIPFLAFRTYTTWEFGMVPSSLILKNLVSIPKEIYELYSEKAVSNVVTSSAGSGV